MEIFHQIHADRSAPSAARESLDVLAGVLSPARFDDLRLVVSELVTNCVQHADLTGDDMVLLTVRLAPDRVRVEVEDCGPGFQGGPRENAPLEAEAGRGLFIVQALTDRWGVTADGQTVVWAELPLAV